MSLNPYSNGICSLSGNNFEKIRESDIVLILILMEYALWEEPRVMEGDNGTKVLILILMEYALWDVSYTRNDGSEGRS